MESIINSINNGFGNCVFLNRDNKSVEGIISNKINDPKLNVLSVKPKGINIEPIDTLHDKLSLLYDDKNVEGVITWRPSKNGKHFVFCHFE